MVRLGRHRLRVRRARPGPQVAAELVTIAGGLGAEAGRHLLRISADPAGLGPGGGLRAGGFLRGEPGRLFGLNGLREGLVPGDFGYVDPLVGLCACLPDRGGKLGFSSGEGGLGLGGGKLGA